MKSLPHSNIEYAVNKDGSRGYCWNFMPGCGNGPDICAVRNTPAGCWAEKLAHRFHRDFTPQFHEDIFNLKFPRKPGARILVCFTGDISYAHYWDIFKASHRIKDTPWHTFILLTKRPKEAYCDIAWPRNAWLGVSLTGAETPERQQQVMAELLAVKGQHKRWLSYEPALGPLAVTLEGIDWLVIGAQGGKGAVIPDLEWITGRDWKYIPRFVWNKCNLRPYLEQWGYKWPVRQELPNG